MQWPFTFPICSKRINYLSIYNVHEHVNSYNLHLYMIDLLQLLTKSNHYNSNYFLEVNVMITITFKVGKIH